MPGPQLERRKIQVSSGHVATGKLNNVASTHPFVQQVDVVFPSNQRLEDALSQLETRYAKGKVRIADIIAQAGEGKLRDFLVLTPAPDTSGDVWCLDPRGVLTLSVCKETYEDLGVAGRALPFKGHSDRHDIQISLGPNPDVEGSSSAATKALVTAKLAKQKTLFEEWEERRKVRDGLDGWDVVWCANSTMTNKDSDLDLGILNSSTQARLVHPTKRQLCSVHIPTISGIFSPRPTPERGSSKARRAEFAEALEDWNEGIFDALEWAGMAILGAQRLQANDQVNSFVAVYEPPSPSRVGDVTHLSWRGLLAPNFVQSIIDTASSILDTETYGSLFAAMTVHGMPISPVGYLSPSGGPPPARLPRVDGEETLTLLLGSPTDSGSDGLGYVVVESISQWDTRWG